MKCMRCGKVNPDNVKQCEKCGYDFKEQLINKQLEKIIKVQDDPDIDPKQKSQLYDNPILTFIFGLLSIMLPIFVFSFLSWHMYKKPAKVKLETLRNFGNVLAYIGICVSMFVTVYLLWGILT